MCEKRVQMQIQCTNKSDVFGIILNSSNLRKREQDQKTKVSNLISGHTFHCLIFTVISHKSNSEACFFNAFIILPE